MIPDWQRASVEFKRQQLRDRVVAYQQQIGMLQGKIERANEKIQRLDRELAERDDRD